MMYIQRIVLLLTVFISTAFNSVGGQDDDDMCVADSPFRYEVRKGDCLFRLAAATSTTINQWLAYNPRITDENFINVGWILCAPAGAVVVPTTVKCVGRKTAQSSAGDASLPAVRLPSATPQPPARRRTAPKGGRQQVTLPRRQPVAPVTSPVEIPVEVQSQGQPVGDSDSSNGLPVQAQQSGNRRPLPGPVFSLQNPGFRPSVSDGISSAGSLPSPPVTRDDNTLSAASPSSPQITQFIQLPASAAADDVPQATRPSIEEPRVQQKPLVKSQQSFTPAQQVGSIDPNVVQCQYFDSGFVNCLRGCTVDMFQWDVDATANTKIMMRQCIENKAPAVHTWLADDGVLLPRLRPRLIHTGQAERIIAACTFTKDRSFTCQGAARCDTASQSVNEGCMAAAQWKGKTSEGDPLKQGTVLKGTISSMSDPEDGAADRAPKRLVRQVSSPVAVPAKGRSSNQRTTLAPNTTVATVAIDCGQIAKSCLYMRDAALAEPIQVTCYIRQDDGTMKRLIQPVTLNDQQSKDIATKMVSVVLQRSECQFFGTDRYLCKGYTGDFCTKQGEQDNETSILYNECYLTDAWSDSTADATASCPPIEPYIRTCILEKGWATDVFKAATCYEKQSGPRSPDSALARLAETPISSLKAIADMADKLKALRAECDFIGSNYYCTGYTANYCDSQWENKIQSNYWDCHAAVSWLGSFRINKFGNISL